ERQARQIGPLVVAELFAGPERGLSGHRVKLFDPDQARSREVVVAGDADRAQLAQPGDHLARLGVVADDIPQAEDAPAGVARFRISEHSIKRIEVAVDVGDHERAQQAHRIIAVARLSEPNGHWGEGFRPAPAGRSMYGEGRYREAPCRSTTWSSATAASSTVPARPRIRETSPSATAASPPSAS